MPRRAVDLALCACSEPIRKQAENDEFDNIVHALNERHDRDGFLSDEFFGL
jgi:hypothetical protein